MKYIEKSCQVIVGNYFCVQAAMPDRWGRCLLGTCYSLWFLHLPAMLQVSSQPAAVLHQAYELLVKMQKLRLDPMEEVLTLY